MSELLSDQPIQPPASDSVCMRSPVCLCKADTVCAMGLGKMQGGGEEAEQVFPPRVRTWQGHPKLG